MRATIDRAGRIVVPKALRDQLHLDVDTPLDISVRDGRIEIEPVPTPMRLVLIDDRLVATTDVDVPTIDADDVRAVMESLRR